MSHQSKPRFSASAVAFFAIPVLVLSVFFMGTGGPKPPTATPAQKALRKAYNTPDFSLLNFSEELFAKAFERTTKEKPAILKRQSDILMDDKLRHKQRDLQKKQI